MWEEGGGRREEGPGHQLGPWNRVLIKSLLFLAVFCSEGEEDEGWMGERLSFVSELGLLEGLVCVRKPGR